MKMFLKNVLIFYLVGFSYEFKLNLPVEIGPLNLKTPSISIGDGLKPFETISSGLKNVTQNVPTIPLLNLTGSSFDIDPMELINLVPGLNVTATYDKLANYSDISKFPDYGLTWAFMPDGDGNPVKVNLFQAKAGILPSFLEVQNLNEKMTFNLYTKNNTDKPIILSIGNTSALSSFDVHKETKFITHGWLSSGEAKVCVSIKDEYMKYNDYNVIIVDWYPISKSLIYPVPMLQVAPVAKYYSEFLTWLISNGAKPDKIHLIGHSLGAHISGVTGKFLNKKLRRVTGLDPASIGFRVLGAITGDRLSSDSAKFVDVIHSCAGVLGMEFSLGHVDFYPNSGIPPQPGCRISQYLEGCSHARSWEYFRDSVNPDNLIQAQQCSKWTFFKSCMDNSTTVMGEHVRETSRGDFYLQTTKHAPFAAKELRS